MHAPLIAYVLLILTLTCHALLQAIAALRLRAVRKEIAATIKSRSDLEKVRDAIQVNLWLGVPVIGNAALLMGVLIWLSNSWLWLVCIVALTVEQAVAWVLFRPMEKQFKALAVEISDGDLAAEYAYYLQQWAGPHLFLKRPQPHQGSEPGAASERGQPRQ